jgi:predicted DNA-binding transcriptional regulator YafY
MDRSERFHKIDRLLKHRAIVPMQLLLEELEVSYATVKRDIEYMRDRLHAPIEWDVILAARRTGVRIEPGVILKWGLRNSVTRPNLGTIRGR